MNTTQTTTLVTKHPLADLINAAIGVHPETLMAYVDTVPLPDTVALVLAPGAAYVAGRPDMSKYPLWERTQVVEHPDSEGPTVYIHFRIPAALAVVLYKLQQVAQGVESTETWQAVLDHLCLPRVWGDDVATELPAANRLALAAPGYFRAAERAAQQFDKGGLQ